MRSKISSTNHGNNLVVALILLVIKSVHGERVWFKDMGNHTIERDYESHNIFIVNGTTVTLEGGSITAPESNDDGEDAVRVEDATFHAKSGIISAGDVVGGTGVTISTTRASDLPPGTATFEAGVEVYGGDATRVDTTKGGDAIQILQSGSAVTFNGGKFVPGTGCTIQVCGKSTDDGVAVQVVNGKAIVKGGTFEGVLYNIDGTIELHGCVKYDEDTQKLTGVLLDGSDIDVVYGQPKGQNSRPTIVYRSDVCPQTPAPVPENGGEKMISHMALVGASLFFGVVVIQH